MKTLRTIIITIAVLAAPSIYAQELTHSVRGRIIDADTKIPAFGATIVVLESYPFIGATTDMDGYFKLEHVTVGRVSLKVQSMGYEEQLIPNVVVNSGKETFLNIELTESITQLATVTIKGDAAKQETINEMSLISARQFSTDETSRYAGTLGDPARMAGNFAGATNSANGDNDIIVRGNSPRGILWQLEGIEIPNPNHFAVAGASGGAISVLNSNLLANSDFLTGAFAPQYGNATSGVFDIKLRQGNNDNREYTLGVGMFGTDITAEGPFKKGGNASYLANYRYSSLALLGQIGMFDMSEGVPKYQDGSFNLYLPSKKIGVFNVFGFGGLSSLLLNQSYSEEVDSVTTIIENNNYVGFTGVSHSYILNEHSYIKSSISVSGNGSNNTIENKDAELGFLLDSKSSFSRVNLKAASTWNTKLNARNKVSAGLIYTSMFYDLNSIKRNQSDAFDQNYGVNENASYLQLHGTWKQRFNENLSMVSGLHFMHFALSNSNSIEPRVAFNYKISPNQTLSAGFGVHSKIESLLDYTSNIADENGVISRPNSDLKLPKANHYIIGYDYLISKNTHLKTEAYFQYLYHVPVEDDPTSNYSTINQQNLSANKSLVSKGNGRNYGLELTLERYFVKSFHYMVTASLFESQYKTLVGKWEKTRYNGNYNLNFLVGKEFNIGDLSKNRTLMLSIKSGLQGANRFNPIDLPQSIASGEETYASDNFSERRDDIFFMNVAASLKVNRKKTTQELKIEVLNVTNNRTVVGEFYNDNTKSVTEAYQWPLLPNIMYTINF